MSQKNRSSWRGWGLGALLALTALVAIVATLRSLPSATVILVRHAEKAQDGSSDPPLTPEGAARAERLAAMLGAAGGTPITRVFSSEFRRTQETVQPLAQRLGVPVTVVPARDTAGLVGRLLTASSGAAVVSGHSNTVPMLIEELTHGRAAPVIADDDFGSLFIVHVAPLGPPSVVRLRY